VETLAELWRPGDAILINAGWVYPAVSIYWPTELPSPTSSRPPAIAAFVRLSEVGSTETAFPDRAPLVFRTGSVNGDVNLGWGLPQSDFYAISDSDTIKALETLATKYRHIWHYRLYDTVSDPNGVIRRWLNENASLEFSQAIPGRDFLLLEGYRTSAAFTPPDATDAGIHFPEASVRLLAYSHSPSIAAGETLYVTLVWEVVEGAPSPLSLSLRLYDGQGQFLLQKDTPLDATHPGASQSLALPLPAGLPPADYQVSLVVYAPETLAPITAMSVEGNELASPLRLGGITVQPATLGK
jgi:hypothetical protein